MCVGLQNDFISLELISGRVVFKYNLGSGPAVIASNRLSNDGKWHQAVAERSVLLPHLELLLKNLMGIDGGVDDDGAYKSFDCLSFCMYLCFVILLTAMKLSRFVYLDGQELFWGVRV